MSPTRQDQRAACGGDGRRAPLVHESVADARDLEALLETGLPAFGGAFLRRIWRLLDQAVGRGLPLTLSISGPVTVSGQHFAWLMPLLDTGWFCLLSTTDAVCYHDGHRSLAAARRHPFHSVPIFGDDGALREESVIRVTDVGFDESILLDQDAFLCELLQRPELQRRMAGTEFRHLLGKAYAEAERAAGVREGLLALCTRKALPIFVGAPADGSVFLNSTKLWAMAKATGGEYRFELDLHAEVLESCAYHLWGLEESESKALGTLVLGGGVPKNYNLQPEPALSQVFGFRDVTGYLYDIQLTTAPVTDGSLSSCPPAEAVTWGKVDKEHYESTCESMQVDYSIVMPFLTKALLDKRARLERLAAELGRAELERRHPEARGYLRAREGYRLFEQRERLVDKLLARVRAEAGRMREESRYPRPAPADAGAGPR
jgi:deoxyhypusine synthase